MTNATVYMRSPASDDRAHCIQNGPTAATDSFPYYDHRTCAEVDSEHVEAAVNSASTIGWHERERRRALIAEIAERRHRGASLAGDWWA